MRLTTTKAKPKRARHRRGPAARAFRAVLVVLAIAALPALPTTGLLLAAAHNTAHNGSSPSPDAYAATSTTLTHAHRADTDQASDISALRWLTGVMATKYRRSEARFVRTMTVGIRN